jgi:hypothetical protein
MRDWSLHLGDPLYLSLAADARLCQPDYLNDHIWEVDLGTADVERAYISLNTTFGLRARSLRLFLRFTENNISVTDPNTFVVKPSLRRSYPNFLSLDFVPLEALQVSAEYWVPESHAITGRVILTNKSTAVRQIKLEVCAMLSPLDGQSLVPTQQQLVNILAGQTSGLAPVVFMTGGPKHGTGIQPSLMLELEFGPGSTRQITFAEAALDTIAGSFELARRSAARNLDAERAQIELLNTSQILDIRTGDPDWDAAFSFSQTAALGLFFNESEHLPHPSFVTARHTDNGFSRKGDGADYPPSWNGQTPLDTYYLSSILHGAPQVTKNLILNFLAAQDENGEVDGKPGLAGQRGKTLAAPMLASLSWRYYQATQDEAFLAENFQKLIKFFWSWFSSAHDRNRDGSPEWDNILQTGFDDNPIFDVWHPWSQGLDISLVHSPSLEAMLYCEATSIAKIVKQLGKPDEEIMLINAQAEILRTSIDAGWNTEQSFYSYRDRETNLVSTGRVIATKRGNGNLRPKEEFKTGVRLLVEIQTQNPAAQRPEIEICEYFTKTKGEIETILGHQFQWRTDGLVATTQKLFTRVGKVSITGLDEKDKVVIRLIDTTGEDLTLALPLWAQVAGVGQADELIARNLLREDRFDRPYGLSSLTVSPGPDADAVSMSVLLPWNQLIGEGLLVYGFRAEAARLTARIMNGVIQNLKQNHSFYQRYHAEKGTGIGERNSLQGFAPVGFFMQTLGVTILSQRRVKLEGRNLFPWAVTIKYKGLTVVRGLEQTVVTFPNGESVIVKEEDPCIVEM